MNDDQTNILLDTGSIISAMSKSFARKLKFKSHMITGKQIDVQVIVTSKVVTTSRTTAKDIHVWEVLYEVEVCIMPYRAGVDLILGTDFTIPAGIRLDLFNATAKLSYEISIPILRSARASFGDEVTEGPARALDVESRSYE